MNARPGRQAVRQANRTFYDLVADKYEAVDGRRSPALMAWLTGLLAGLRAQAPGGTLLDLGAGGGLVCRCAAGVFDTCLAVDISPNILAAHRAHFTLGLAADADELPFADQSLDAAAAFATLHHLHGFAALARELFRVLKPGGVFLSDHDMDQAFHDRFRLPLGLYRRLRGAKAKYVGAVPGLTNELYELSEFHEQGIDAVALAEHFKAAGFTVRLTYHWYGLSGPTDRLFGTTTCRRALAPLIRLRAEKPGRVSART